MAMLRGSRSKINLTIEIITLICLNCTNILLNIEIGNLPASKLIHNYVKNTPKYNLSSKIFKDVRDWYRFQQ